MITQLALTNGQYIQKQNILFHSIKFSTNEWAYNFLAVPREFVSSPSISSRLTRYQIEKDGSLYLLMPSDIAPVVNFSRQPKGYPLKPKLAHVADIARKDSALLTQLKP